MKLSSGRWYPGVATLPDGKVLMVAGVAKSGCRCGGPGAGPCRCQCKWQRKSPTSPCPAPSPRSNYMVPKPCNAANNPSERRCRWVAGGRHSGRGGCLPGSSPALRVADLTTHTCPACSL